LSLFCAAAGPWALRLCDLPWVSKSDKSAKSAGELGGGPGRSRASAYGKLAILLGGTGRERAAGLGGVVPRHGR
jgi:hypothetical protein